MRKYLKIAAVVNFVVNVVLFLIKIVVGLMFSSVSLIGDAFNSLSDIIAAFFIYVSVKINDEEADDRHQFGHTRAENISGYTTGLLMVILGFSIIKIGVEKIVYKELVVYNNLLIVVVIITLILKGFMFFYVRSVLAKHKSPALEANLKDHRNDMLMILGVFVAILALKLGYPIFDAIVGILIGLFVLKEGYLIVKENINYLMGISAPQDLIMNIKEIVFGVNDVRKITKLKTQYLGSKVQVELHIACDKNMTIENVHILCEKLGKKIEDLEDIDHCFIHVNPF